MKNKIQYLITLLTIGIFISACHSTAIKKKNTNILTIVATTASGSIPPWLRKSEYIEIKNDLSTHYVVKNYQGKIIKDKHGKVTQAYFDDLVKPLKNINLAKIKSVKLPLARLGGGPRNITIQTDKGKYDYTGGAQYNFPKEISQVFFKVIAID